MERSPLSARRFGAWLLLLGGLLAACLALGTILGAGEVSWARLLPGGA